MSFIRRDSECLLGLVLCICVIAPALAQTNTASEDNSAELSAGLVQGNLLAPKAFRQAAAKIRPTVVSIETFGGVAGAGAGKSSNAKGALGPTTGVILSADGYIVTSTFNFIDKPPVITVIFSDGKRKVAQLLGRDETRKLCLLKVEGVSDLPTPELADPQTLRVGQWVVALGVGFGETAPSLSAGILSATNRMSGKAVQTDANLSPANYGGPLIDLEGKLIGICAPMSPGSYETAAGAEWYDSGIGFAVPLHGLDRVIADMKAGKTLQRGYLAVQAASYGEPARGAEIKKVIPGFAADKAGLKAGDKLLQINGEEILDVTHLNTLVAKYYLQDKVKIDLLRGSEQQTLELTLGAMPPPPKNENPLEALKKLIPKPNAPPPPK
jgi:serine protease Do